MCALNPVLDGCRRLAVDYADKSPLVLGVRSPKNYLSTPPLLQPLYAASQMPVIIAKYLPQALGVGTLAPITWSAKLGLMSHVVSFQAVRRKVSQLRSYIPDALKAVAGVHG